MSELVLGLGLSHDASACLLRDGKPLVGIQLERLTRRKHDGRLREAHRMIDYVLDAAGVSLSEVAAVGVTKPGLDLLRNLRVGDLDLAGPQVLHVGHHLAHAYSAFAPSGFGNAAVLVVDGHGDGYTASRQRDMWMTGPELVGLLEEEALSMGSSESAPRYETESIYHFTRTAAPVLLHRSFLRFGARRGHTRELFDWLGIGSNYSQVSAWLFGSGQAAGKVMGLAPYGDPAALGLPDPFVWNGGVLTPIDDWKAEIRQQLFEDPTLRSNHSWASGLAAFVQHHTETAVLELARRALASADCINLCMAGGVALNATTNGRIEREVVRGRMYVQPASSDAGLALGAALAADHHLSGVIRGYQPPRDEWGRRYSRAEVLQAIPADVGLKISVDEDLNRAADHLAPVFR